MFIRLCHKWFFGWYLTKLSLKLFSQNSNTSLNCSIGKGLEKSHTDARVQAFLLFDEKQSFRKLGDIIYQEYKSGEVYVRRDALTVLFGEKILYGNLLTYGGNGLSLLWQLAVTEGSLLRKKGVVALGVQNAAIVWVERKPPQLGNVTGTFTTYIYCAHCASINLLPSNDACTDHDCLLIFDKPMSLIGILLLALSLQCIVSTFQASS